METKYINVTETYTLYPVLLNVGKNDGSQSI